MFVYSLKIIDIPFGKAIDILMEVAEKTWFIKMSSVTWEINGIIGPPHTCNMAANTDYDFITAIKGKLSIELNCQWKVGMIELTK